MLRFFFDEKNSLFNGKYFFINNMTYIICIIEKMRKKMHDKLTIIVR
jgi:hypothetical protein